MKGVKRLNDRTIPGTALTPSVICMGTAHLGSRLDERMSHRMLDAYAGRGGNFIDTANVYSDWIPGEKSRSEKTIGRWLRQRGNRSSIVLATKGAHPELSTMHVPRIDRASIMHDVEQSLGHLQTDYIDLYWLHRDDPGTPVAGIMETLNELIAAGKIRAIGCSNWTASRIEEANLYAAEHGLQGFAANQPMWSLAVPDEAKIADKTMVPMRAEGEAFHLRTGMAAVPYSSQANGFFGGKYRAGDEWPGKLKVYAHAENFGRLARVESAAARLGLTQTQVALGYLLSQNYPVFPIIGSSDERQLEESMSAGDVTLDAETVRYLRDGRQGV